jgi:hypothetical protein
MRPLSTDPPFALHLRVLGTPRLHCEPRKLLNFDFNADPDPAFHLNADPDPAFHFNADPDPAFLFDADSDPASHQGDFNLRPLVNRPSRPPF